MEIEKRLRNLHFQFLLDTTQNSYNRMTPKDLSTNIIEFEMLDKNRTICTYFSSIHRELLQFLYTLCILSVSIEIICPIHVDMNS